MNEVRKGIPIVWVFPDSIAWELGIEPGDHLLSIEGQLPKDYIDFVYLTSDEELELVIQKPDGEIVFLTVERDPGEELGFQLDGIIYDQLHECSNHCMFCFVHQMPPGLRQTLSLKDDDYRFSFLQGSFITLTNLSQREIDRIKGLRLSPLYVSVHTTNPALRQRMMGNKAAGRVLEILRELKEAGIEFHTQIVLCPGLNDGEELCRSIEELASLRPNLQSLAVVPVGLTRYREKLYPLTSFTPEQAREVFGLVRSYQERFAAEDENFLYLSDEFYLLTGHTFPACEEYHGFPQLENGVGLSRLLLDEMAALEKELPEEMVRPTRLLLVTGLLAAKVLAEPVARLRKVKDLTVDFLVVENEFFGPAVTVAGLLTGQDIRKAVRKHGDAGYDLVILPCVVLNDDDLFIDGMTREEFEENIPRAVFVDGLYSLADQLVERNLMEVKPQ